MSHLDIEIQNLRSDMFQMWKLVEDQLQKGMEALVNFDKDLAREIVAKEKYVNSYELKIDRDCENIFALFNPVAIDLRLVLAILKINSNLERIGDIAEGIARFVIDADQKFDTELLETTGIIEMFKTANIITSDTAKAFETEDTKLSRTIFIKDEKLDEINNVASYAIEKYIKKHPDNIRTSLHLLSIIRKLERVGDQNKNIAEEIIFYIEAKVLKHGKKS